MRIFIVGYMGSGKSSQGKKLAAKLKKPFYDLDKMMVDIEGMSVARIFSEKGEPYFRELEADVLRSTILFPDAVISTGGGTPCYFNNMQWMNTRGLTVYFHLPAGMIYERLRKKKEKRPLIAHMDDNTLRDYIIQKSAEREYFYKKADCTFHLAKTPVKEIAKVLQEKMHHLK